MDIKKGLSLEANIEALDKHAPWSHISSRTLAKILGVSLQTINNWKMRNILPQPEPRSRFKGNRNYYKVSKIRSWLSGKDEESLTWEWITKYIPDYTHTSIEPAMQVVKVGHTILGVEKPVTG